MPCAREGYGHIRLDFVLIISYTMEDLEFLDTPVYIDTYVVTLHEYNTIMTVLIVSVKQISFSITHVVNFVWNVAHMIFSVVD